MEPEVEEERTESESESSEDGICCEAENRALAEDLETIEPFLLSNPFHSRVTPLHPGSLCSRSARP